MGVARQLFQLQETELKLESAQQTLKELSSQLGESQRVIQAQAEVSTARQKLEDLGKQQRSAEWDVKDLDSKISTPEHRLYSGEVRNPKELANLQADIDGIKKRRSQFEDKTLALIDQVEQAEAEVKLLAVKLSDLKAEWRRQQNRLNSEIKQLEATIAGLERERQQILPYIDPGTLDLYKRLRTYKGQAVAKIEQGVCSGCRVALPTTDLQRARGDSLVQCSSCGRILFMA